MTPTVPRPRRHDRRRTAVAVVAAAFAVAVAPADPASAASARGQQTYACENAPDDGTTPSRPDTFQLGMTLDVPASVPPGGTVSLRGTADVRLPESYRQAIDYFRVEQVDAVSDSLHASVTVGGRTVAQPADRWSTGPQRVGNPLVLTAPVSFPTFRIPADATGSITIALPGNGFVGTSFPGKTPEKVAFNARATARGPVSYPFKVSCFVKSGGPNVVATIPISAPAAAGGATPAPTSTAPARSGGASGSADRTDSRTATDRSGASRGTAGDAPGSAGSGSDAPAGSGRTAPRSAATANPFRASSSSATGATGESAGTTADPGAAGGAGAATEVGAPAAAIPELVSGREEDGVRIGSAWLWAAGLALVGGCVAWAVVSRLRLRALLDDEDRL